MFHVRKMRKCAFSLFSRRAARLVESVHLWYCIEIDAFSPTVSHCTSWSFRKKMMTRRGEAKFSITKLIEFASLENTPVVGRQLVAFSLKQFPNCKNSQ
ncbi:hypothetical protein T4B_11916, partial [Trichinella pseudospiralis]